MKTIILMLFLVSMCYAGTTDYIDLEIDNKGTYHLELLELEVNDNIPYADISFDSGGGLYFYGDGRIVWKGKEITNDKELVEALKAAVYGLFCDRCREKWREDK